jgi:N-acetylglucosaminyldiphosphoundecaprenol N-acetyl-beta-D-mannosaminyltransferase
MSSGQVQLAGLAFDRVTEAQAVRRIIDAGSRGAGGWVATPNIDICRKASQDRALRDLIRSASLVVADGMPLVWAARLRRDALPERVAGGSMIFSLSEAAAAAGRSIYLLGGAPGVPERAARELCARYQGLIVAGTDAPPLGFESDPAELEAIAKRVAAASPDIVFVGMGFPRQERLITRLAPESPGAWFVGCGAAIPYAAKVLPRPPSWMRSAGLAWLFRLISEPRRLIKRYLVQDAPFAARLLSAAAVSRLRPPSARRRS